MGAEETVCEVCGDGARKYKTPCCKAWYCCVQCYKNHFEVKGCAGQRKEREEERERRVRVLAEDQLRERELVDDLTISSKQLEAVSRDSSIRAQIRDPALQELITNIDKDPDRLSALNTACLFNPDFHAFTERVADLIAMHEPATKRTRRSAAAKPAAAKPQAQEQQQEGAPVDAPPTPPPEEVVL
eukprot:TRINITY_DN2258_c0_g1_i1.p1 TRINITY_DN2258_c0_g1~~TRINITY_DN2258_c0_g1_i1.p1  ORF type:complete len:186 (+),score=76.67 TRINITY_DN2258_c0_g1_i1:48-605(+)